MKLLLWGLLAASAVAGAATLRALHVPGAVLLGPMVVAVGFALCGAKLQMKPAVLLVVQAVLGCMIASAVTRPLLQLVADHWAVVLTVNVLSVAAACAVAVVLTRTRLLPGQSAVWGLSPGAASTMMMLGEARGEDPRVIALMQNLRVVAVALSATTIAALVEGPARPAGPGVGTLLNASYSNDGALTITALVFAGILTAVLTRWRQAAFWVPVISGGLLNASELGDVDIPAALAAAAFGIGGCYAGLRFDRVAVSRCLRLMPAMLLGIALLMAACAVLMWPVRQSFAGVSSLTAFLAVMPGGIDAAVAIATGLEASVPVIVAVQVMRVVVVSLVAPPAARLVAQLCTDR